MNPSVSGLEAELNAWFLNLVEPSKAWDARDFDRLWLLEGEIPDLQRLRASR